MSEHCHAARMIRKGVSNYPLAEHQRDCDACQADLEIDRLRAEIEQCQSEMAFLLGASQGAELEGYSRAACRALVEAIQRSAANILPAECETTKDTPEADGPGVIRCICGHRMADQIEGFDPCSLCDCEEFVEKLPEQDTLPFEELNILGMRVMLIDTDNDNEVAFVQNGKVIGRIVLEKG